MPDVAFVPAELTCKCGLTLLLQWEARPSLSFGTGSRATCPSCGAEHLIPAPLLRGLAKHGDDWVQFFPDPT